jgi:hypothetical protein
LLVATAACYTLALVLFLGAFFSALGPPEPNAVTHNGDYRDAWHMFWASASFLVAGVALTAWLKSGEDH